MDKQPTNFLKQMLREADDDVVEFFRFYGSSKLTRSRISQWVIRDVRESESSRHQGADIKKKIQELPWKDSCRLSTKLCRQWQRFQYVKNVLRDKVLCS